MSFQHSPSPTSSASGESSALARPQHQQGAEGPPPSYDPFVANPTASVGNEGSSSAAPSLTLSTTKTIDKLPTDLECVEDDFEEGAHEKTGRADSSVLSTRNSPKHR